LASDDEERRDILQNLDDYDMDLEDTRDAYHEAVKASEAFISDLHKQVPYFLNYYEGRAAPPMFGLNKTNIAESCAAAATGYREKAVPHAIRIILESVNMEYAMSCRLHAMQPHNRNRCFRCKQQWEI
jgi:hypothetical protein